MAISIGKQYLACVNVLFLSSGTDICLILNTFVELALEFPAICHELFQFVSMFQYSKTARDSFGTELIKTIRILMATIQNHLLRDCCSREEIQRILIPMAQDIANSTADYALHEAYQELNIR